MQRVTLLVPLAGAPSVRPHNLGTRAYRVSVSRLRNDGLGFGDGSTMPRLMTSTCYAGPQGDDPQVQGGGLREQGYG